MNYHNIEMKRHYVLQQGDLLLKLRLKQPSLTLSEFLRISGLEGKIDMKKKIIPREVLQGIADLNHIAANLNQIAKKRNNFDD